MHIWLKSYCCFFGYCLHVLVIVESVRLDILAMEKNRQAFCSGVLVLKYSQGVYAHQT